MYRSDFTLAQIKRTKLRKKNDICKFFDKLFCVSPKLLPPVAYQHTKREAICPSSRDMMVRC